MSETKWIPGQLRLHMKTMHSLLAVLEGIDEVTTQHEQDHEMMKLGAIRGHTPHEHEDKVNGGT